MGGNLIIPNRLECISIECLRAKTKVITTTNQMRGKQYKEPILKSQERMICSSFFYLIGCENGATISMTYDSQFKIVLLHFSFASWVSQKKPLSLAMLF